MPMTDNNTVHPNLPVGNIVSIGTVLDSSDTLSRAVEALQNTPSRGILVLENGYYFGFLTDAEVARALATDPAMTAGEASAREVPVIPADTPCRDALRTLAEADLSALPVVARDGRLLGAISRAELLESLYRRRRPASIGGMATPLGVYLSDGTHRGGVGDFALILTGVFLFIGSLLSAAVALGVVFAWRRLGLAGIIPAPWIITSAFLLAFSAWFRLSRVAGYHAAEHQTVHAIERNEPLEPERVAMMPRPHPRCGTNLMVLFSVFMTMTAWMKIDLFVAVVIALAAYRFLGPWVQQNITTRPASRRQIENGISAGRQILDQYQQGTSWSSRSGWKRIWNMGLLQVSIGYMAPAYALPLLAESVPFVQSLARFLQ